MPYIFPPAGPESTEKSLAKKQWHFTETLKQGVNTETPLHLRWCSTVLSGNSCPRSPSCRRLCSGSSSRWWTSSLFLTKWPKERSWGSHRSLQRSPEIQRWSSSSSWTDGGSHPQNRGSSTTHSSQAEGECVCVCVCAKNNGWCFPLGSSWRPTEAERRKWAAAASDREGLEVKVERCARFTQRSRKKSPLDPAWKWKWSGLKMTFGHRSGSNHFVWLLVQTRVF